MSEIYSDLQSPTISSDPHLSRIIRKILSGSGPDGLITEIYGYQRRSVVAMLQWEIPNRRAGLSDPLYLPMAGIDGEFYLRPAKMSILREHLRVSPTRGGILRDELGE